MGEVFSIDGEQTSTTALAVSRPAGGRLWRWSVHLEDEHDHPKSANHYVAVAVAQLRGGGGGTNATAGDRDP